jgi:hypothetical protein
MDISSDFSAPKNDTKRKRFIKIAESRVNRILNNLDSLGKCSNKRNYEYSENDVQKIFREIERKMKETKFLFGNGKNKQKRFKL